MQAYQLFSYKFHFYIIHISISYFYYVCAWSFYLTNGWHHCDEAGSVLHLDKNIIHYVTQVKTYLIPIIIQLTRTHDRNSYLYYRVLTEQSVVRRLFTHRHFEQIYSFKLRTSEWLESRWGSSSLTNFQLLYTDMGKSERIEFLWCSFARKKHRTIFNGGHTVS